MNSKLHKEQNRRDKEELEKYLDSLGERGISLASEDALSAARGFIYKNTTSATPAFRDYLYVDSILSSMRLKEDKRGAFIICTDGEAIYYNPRRLLAFKKGIEMAGGDGATCRLPALPLQRGGYSPIRSECSTGERTIAGILVHEALHILLGHTDKTGRGKSILEGAGADSPGAAVLSAIRNVAMDKEVNRHVFHMVPGIHTGPAPACGWGGMVKPDSGGPVDSESVGRGEPLRSFEDYYAEGMQKMLEKTCAQMERPAPRWGTIEEGERLVVATAEEFLKRSRKQRRRTGGADKANQNRGIKQIKDISGIRAQEHDGLQSRTHEMLGEASKARAKQAFARADELASARGWAPGSAGDGVWKGSLERQSEVLGRPGKEGLIAGSWSDMIKQVMTGIAGETALDDWSVKDPMSEIYESLGFGEAILPGKRLLRTGSLMCVLDVSGSISDEYFLGAWMEMSAVAGALPPGAEVTFAQVDTEIRYLATGTVGDASFAEMKESIDEGVIMRHGWGKTDFTSFFESVNNMERKPDCIVFFSDMKFMWEKLDLLDPGVPVLWVTLREHFAREGLKKLPFGQAYEMGELGVRLARDNMNRVAPVSLKEPEENDTRLEGVLGSGYLFDIPM